VKFGDVANRRPSEYFNGFSQPVFSASLIAHLSDNAHFCRDFPHQASFANGPGQRFCTYTCFSSSMALMAAAACVWSGRADADDVDFVAEFVQHFAEVRELLGLCEFFGLLGQCASVNVTDSDDFDILSGDVAAVAVTLAANSDTGRCQIFKCRSRWPSECLRATQNAVPRAADVPRKPRRDVFCFMSVPQEVSGTEIIGFKGGLHGTAFRRRVSQVRKPDDKRLTITTPKETATIRGFCPEIRRGRRNGLLLARRSVGGARRVCL